MRATLAMLLLVLVCADRGRAAPPGKSPVGMPGARYPRAERHLAEGEYRRAARTFRTLLDRDPTEPALRMGLARALTPLWDCEEPLDLLDSLRGADHWGSEEASLEAACLEVRGDLAQAQAAVDEAWLLGPNASTAGQRAFLAIQAGDARRFEAALDDVRAEAAHGLPAALLQAWAALEWGESDLEEHLAEARQVAIDLEILEAGAQIAVIDGRRWLDLDDPTTALVLLRPAMMRHREDPRLGIWQLEATRRAGDAAMAAMGERRPGLRRAHGALADGVRARIFVDVGELDTAAGYLEGLEGSDDPEVLASQWYLARARGDAEAMTRYARLWDGRNVNPDRSLEQLIPIERR